MVFDLGVDTMVLRWVVKKGDVNGSRKVGANRAGIPNFAVDSAVASEQYASCSGISNGKGRCIKFSCPWASPRLVVDELRLKPQVLPLAWTQSLML